MEFKASLKFLSIVFDDKLLLISPPKIGFKALLAATMATLLTANIAGVIMI